jgi:hypothetical protein
MKVDIHIAALAMAPGASRAPLDRPGGRAGQALLWAATSRARLVATTPAIW